VRIEAAEQLAILELTSHRETYFIYRQLSLDALRNRILAAAREAGISPSAWSVQGSVQELTHPSGQAEKPDL
jgi:hypothetical protein